MLRRQKVYCVERLFSGANPRSQRASTDPRTYEIILYLHCNTGVCGRQDGFSNHRSIPAETARCVCLWRMRHFSPHLGAIVSRDGIYYCLITASGIYWNIKVACRYYCVSNNICIYYWRLIWSININTTMDWHALATKYTLPTAWLSAPSSLILTRNIECLFGRAHQVNSKLLFHLPDTKLSRLSIV